jgi:hypothetical protein
MSCALQVVAVELLVAVERAVFFIHPHNHLHLVQERL